MSDAKRMHALMIGQPNFGAPDKPKGRPRKNGRFVKAEPAAAPPPPPEPPPEPEPEPAAAAAPDPDTASPDTHADSWQDFVQRQIGRA